MGLNALLIALYLLDVLQVEEDGKKMTSVLVATYYFLCVFLLDDLESSMKEENEEIAEVQIGILIAVLAEHFEEQQSGRMHG